MTDRPVRNLPAPAGGWGSPWPQAFEVATVLPPGSWTLVGGLMVQLHARLAQLPPSRPTTDVDATLHLETGVIDYPTAAAALTRTGYAFDDRPAHAYRFRRDADVVDLMTADHLVPAHRPRYAGRPVLAIDGGTQALKRTINVDVETGDGSLARFSIPNVHGALVLKGAAYLADSRDRIRHASDAVVLLACVDDVDALIRALAGSDRRRLNAIVRALDDPEAWADAHRDVEALARATIDDLGPHL